MPTYIKTGATLPIYRKQLLRNPREVDQVPVDLSNAAGVSRVDVTLRRVVAGVLGTIYKKFQATRTFPDVSAASPDFLTKGGAVEFRWLLEDTVVPVLYAVEFDITYVPSGDVETVPNMGYFYVSVEQDLDLTT